ncbi:MAG: patatin-like phospholipase family protein [Terriglobales bacterium]
MSSVSVEEVLRREFLEVEASRTLRMGEDRQRPEAQKSLIGLAFSGGGIRSATFNLGVLQALSRTRLLHFFDYVSTVSGGGYIGGWLMAWMHHQKIGIREIENRLSSEKYSTRNAADPHEVHFLRDYSNYLTPRKGILGADFWAFVATYLRNTILNQIILVLLLLSVLLLPRTLVYLPNRLEALENLTHHAFPAQDAAFLLAVCLVTCAVAFMGLNLAWVDPHASRRCPWYAKQWGIQLLVVIPLIAAAALASYSISYFMDADLFDEPLWQVPLMATLLYVLCWVGAFLVRAVRGKRGIRGTDGPNMGLVIVTAAVTGVLIGYLLLPFGKFMTPPPPPLDDYFNWRIFAFGTPLFVLIMLMVGTLHIGLMGRGMSDGHREWWARLGGWLMIYCICWLLLFWMAIYVPVELAGLWAAHSTKIFTTGTTVWMLSTAYGVLFGKNKDTSGSNPAAPPSKKVLGYVARLTPYIFIAGLFAGLSLLAAEIALTLTNSPIPLDHLPRAFSGPGVLVACMALFGAAFVLSWRVNINEFSIHHAYRNRLVRCYLGASVPCRSAQPFTGFSEADDLPLANLQIPLSSRDPKDGRPLPILNTSLNVVRGKELALQTRKARSFAFTPLFAGFTREATNGSEWQSAYAATRESGSRQRGCDNGISLGTAVAISGAAASPNMGSYSEPALAFLMTLFDVRLGWWIANPAVPKNWRIGGPRVGFFWLLRELMGSTNDDSGFVYLSDGGHFENLAIYELVRRGCKLIVAGDASCDPGAGFGDLHNAIERCRADFGVEIVLDASKTKRLQNSLATSHCAVGKIRYSPSPADDGVIIYLKPTLVAGDPADVLGYTTTNPSFPDDTTANQWFDEAHFENYRALGEVSGLAAEAAIREALNHLMPQTTSAPAQVSGWKHGT